MEITALIPHYKEGRMTAYCVAQLLKFKGNHKLNIIVVDNNAGDGSVDYLYPFRGQVQYIQYPKEKLQSHGIAFDYCMPYVDTDYFICFESDSFPTKERWLDKYESFAKNKYDLVGSPMKLSGGEYIHPTGTFYSRNLWKKAKDYCDNIQYTYFPNMSMKDTFACHLMVHNSILDDFLKEPNDYIVLADGYNGLSVDQMLEKAAHYSPTINPFHNGMGTSDESLYTYGQRTILSEQNRVLLGDRPKLINRIGEEPGQWLTYFAIASGATVVRVPCETKWMANRENQQQEYTINEMGIKHIWCGSSYLDMKESMPDVYEFKKNQIEELYNSLPNHQKINL